MRIEEEVKIKISDTETRVFKVYEARPKDVLSALLMANECPDLTVKKLFGDEFLPQLTNATIEDLSNLYPSDVNKLFEAIKRVNAPLLEAVRESHGPQIEALKSSIINILLTSVAGLFVPDIPTASNMDGNSSFALSMKSQPGATIH